MLTQAFGFPSLYAQVEQMAVTSEELQDEEQAVADRAAKLFEVSPVPDTQTSDLMTENEANLVLYARLHALQRPINVAFMQMPRQPGPAVEPVGADAQAPPAETQFMITDKCRKAMAFVALRQPDALDQGLSFECDLQVLRTSEVILLHDDTLERTAAKWSAETNATGLDEAQYAQLVRAPASTLSYDELSRVDVGSWFDAAHSEERVPLFSQALQALKEAGGDACCFAELIFSLVLRSCIFT